MSNFKQAVKDAKEFARGEGGNWCVVERRDPEGGFMEYAAAPSSVVCDENEKIVWPVPTETMPTETMPTETTFIEIADFAAKADMLERMFLRFLEDAKNDADSDLPRMANRLRKNMETQLTMTRTRADALPSGEPGGWG